MAAMTGRVLLLTLPEPARGAIVSMLGNADAEIVAFRLAGLRVISAMAVCLACPLLIYWGAC